MSVFTIFKWMCSHSCGYGCGNPSRPWLQLYWLNHWNIILGCWLDSSALEDSVQSVRIHLAVLAHPLMLKSPCQMVLFFPLHYCLCPNRVDFGQPNLIVQRVHETAELLWTVRHLTRLSKKKFLFLLWCDANCVHVGLGSVFSCSPSESQQRLFSPCCQQPHVSAAGISAGLVPLQCCRHVLHRVASGKGLVQTHAGGSAAPGLSGTENETVQQRVVL